MVSFPCCELFFCGMGWRGSRWRSPPGVHARLRPCCCCLRARRQQQRLLRWTSVRAGAAGADCIAGWREGFRRRARRQGRRRPRALPGTTDGHLTAAQETCAQAPGVVDFSQAGPDLTKPATAFGDGRRRHAWNPEVKIRLAKNPLGPSPCHAHWVLVDPSRRSVVGQNRRPGPPPGRCPGCGAQTEHRCRHHRLERPAPPRRAERAHHRCPHESPPSHHFKDVPLAVISLECFV